MHEMIKQLLDLAGGTAQDLIRLFETEVLKNADARERGGTFLELATVLHDLGRNNDALTLARKARSYFKKINDQKGICYSLINEGIYLDQLRDFPAALTSFEKASKVNRELNEDSAASKIHVGLGRTYNNLARFENAITHFEQAEVLKTRISDVVGLAKCRLGLGLAHYSLGSFEQAAAIFQELVAMSIKLNDPEMQADARNNLGNVFLRMSRFDEALEEQNTALAIGESLNKPQMISSAHINIGITFGHLGDFKSAIKHNAKALEISDNLLERGTALQNIGNAYFNQGEFQESLRFFESALEIKESHNELEGVLLCSMNLGNSYGSLGQFDDAIKWQRRALSVSQRIGDRFNESLCLSNLGVSFFLNGKTKAAIKHLRAAATLARECGAIHLESQAEFGLTRIFREGLNDLSGAYEHCKRAAELGETLTQGLKHQDSKIGFFGRLSTPYEYLLRCCLELGNRTEEAFEVLERSKSRSLVEILSSGPLQPTKAVHEDFAALLEAENKLLAALREWQTRAWRVANHVPDLKDFTKIRSDLDVLYKEMERYDPEYVSLRRGETVTFDDVKSFVNAAERPMVVVEYFVGADSISIFLISSRESQIKVFIKEVEKSRLLTCLKKYRQAVDHLSESDRATEQMEIARLVIEPIKEWTEGGDLICFVPHGPLHFIPLHALPVDNEPILRRHPIVYSPSSSVILGLHKKQKQTLRSCVAFGVGVTAEQEESGELTEDYVNKMKELFEGEALAVAEQYEVEALTGSNATKESFGEISEADVLHFSCHGYFNPADPLSSGLLMYDGTLTAREIFGMRLRSEMVVLSACETAFSERSRGDELIGLIRSFLYAGSRSVVASLWPVDAHSTRDLMVRFHSFVQAGYDRATALQLAQLAIADRSEYMHPYYWAPFVLVGAGINCLPPSQISPRNTIS